MIAMYLSGLRDLARFLMIWIEVIALFIWLCMSNVMSTLIKVAYYLFLRPLYEVGTSSLITGMVADAINSAL